MEWFVDNAQLISAMATVLMTLAWVIYAHFGIITYIRQRRPRIVIDKTADNTINTRFVIVNLSEFPIYISGILIVVRRRGEEIVHKIEKYQRASTDDGEELNSLEYAESQLRHGTLDSGQLFMLGSSRETLSWLLEDDPDEATRDRAQRLRAALNAVDEFEFRVVAMAGNDDRPIASSRRFQIECREDGNEVFISPADPSTRQYATWRQRSVAEEWSSVMRQL